MKKSIFKFLGLSVAVLFVMSMVYSCGSSSSSSSSSGPTPSGVTVTLSATSGTIGAVNLNSMLIDTISVASGSVDPTTISVSVSPSFTETTSQGFNSGSFAGYVDIIPAGFLPAATTFSVTTSFKKTGGTTTYTEYNAFTTVTSAGAPASGPGSSYIVTVNNVTQPAGLASLLSGNIPTLAISVVAGTAALNPTAAGAEGSMIMFGGEAASNVSPTDILSLAKGGFALPFAAQYTGDEFMSSGSAALTVASISIPLATFDLSGIANADGTISSGVLYGVVHCTDSACTNLGTTVGGVVSQYIDANGNMVVLGTFTGAPNTVPSVAWIGSTDTANTNLSASGVTTSTALLEVTTTSSPLLSTATLPFVILTQTDANNMMSIVGVGQAPDSPPLTSPISFTYPLVEPGVSGTPFSTTVGQNYGAYFMFGLTNSKTVSFKP